jgi:hypothetical protein
MAQGIKGDAGATPTIQIGSVTSVANGVSPTVTIDPILSTPTNQILDFTLEAGITPQLYIGSVHSLPNGTSSQVSLSAWPAPFIGAYNINFGLEKGDKGGKGDKGDAGADGSVAGIIGAALGAASILVSGITYTTLSSALAGLASAIAIVNAQVSALEFKTFYQSVEFATTVFRGSGISINNMLGPQIELSSDGNIICGPLAVKDLTGSQVFYVDRTGKIVCGKIASSESITVGAPYTSIHSINGSMLNVNCTNINLNGIVSFRQSFYANSSSPYQQIGY